VHQTDLGTFTTVSARKQRASRCLGLASGDPESFYDFGVRSPGLSESCTW
jgi:hypothetical protein